MGKILLIEPHKILQRAVSLALFPDHEVKIEEGIEGALGSLKEYDLLIVDGAALRERDELTSEAMRSVQSCATPTLWLEEDNAAQAPKRDRLVVVRKPVDKGAFESALAGLLPSAGGRARGGLLAAGAAKGIGSKGPSRKRAAEAPVQTTLQFIDLVDVVEERPPPKQARKNPRKSK